MNLSLRSSAPHLFPETKTSLGAVSRKIVGKPSCRLEFVHIKYVEKQAHLIYRCKQEAHLVVCGLNGGMLTTEAKSVNHAHTKEERRMGGEQSERIIQKLKEIKVCLRWTK